MLCLYAAAAAALAAPPAVVFPDAPPDARPAPVPDPAAPVPVSGDTLYVVSSDAPFLVFASPRGLVSVTKETGPLRIRGRFSDGGRVQTKTFSAKHLAIVEAVGKGDVELLVVPEGAKTEADALVRQLRVDAGAGPRPPPKPPDPPQPPQPPDPLAAAARAAYAADPSPTKAADKAAMAAVFRALAAAVGNADVRTAKNLYDLNADSMRARIDGRLGGVGRVLATDFGTIFPAGTREGYVLTPADRDAAKAKLLRYALLVDGIEP